jgi:hypothetical protein
MFHVFWFQNLTGGRKGGLFITDVTNASRTMLMNIETLQWDPVLCRYCHLYLCLCWWVWDSVSELWPPTGLLFILQITCEMESHGGMILKGENRRTQRKTFPCANLSATNPRWTDPGTNQGLSGEKLTSKHLSHSTATFVWTAHEAEIEHIDFLRSSPFWKECYTA